MEHRKAICLVVDGLRASALGTYGNTQFATPQMDLLASHSVVAEWMLADSLTLSGFYRAAWEGKHALRSASHATNDSVLHRLARQRVCQTLLTDDQWLLEQAEEYSFDDILPHEQVDSQSEGDFQTTMLEGFFAEAIDHLQDWKESIQGQNGLLWCHSRGMFGPWDAPLTLRQELLDEDDPPAGEFTEPPRHIQCGDDPDLLLSYRVAYAAQIMMLDTCVGAFVAAVEDLFSDTETLVMLVGSRGIALGEHSELGTDCTNLHSERIHVPWLMHQCGSTIPQQRAQSLSQPVDIGACLEAWFAIESESGAKQDGLASMLQTTNLAGQQRELAVAIGEQGERMVRTPAWKLVTDGSANQQTGQLFTKPDDRWERNDIGSLCPDVVEQLHAELDRYEQLGKCGDPLPLTASLPELTQASR